MTDPNSALEVPLFFASASGHLLIHINQLFVLIHCVLCITSAILPGFTCFEEYFEILDCMFLLQ